MRAVHQLVGALHPGDAVGREVLTIQAILRRHGFESDVFAGWIDPRLDGQARLLPQHAEVLGSATACLYHFAGESPAGRIAYHSACPLVLVYHNVTPAEYFLDYSPQLARFSFQGRRELRAFASRSCLALAKSEFSRQELVEAGFARTGVMPFVQDLAFLQARPSPVATRFFRDPRRTVLCVGRIVPNKKIEDVLRGFALYQRHYQRRSRLLLVGDTRLERYLDSLLGMVRALSLEHVEFAAHVDDDDLLACYAAADVFLSLSEHEGYGVPLLEAMDRGVPVVAYAAAAIAETLGGGGVLLHDKNPELVAAVIDRVVSDAGFRSAVLCSQQQVVERLRATDFGALLIECLSPVIGSAGAEAGP